MLFRLHELDDGHFSSIAAARANSDYSGVAAVSFGVFRCDLVKEFFGDIFLRYEGIHKTLSLIHI